MSRFNSFLMNNFAGCKLLARCYDPHRSRDVALYLVPGYTDVVGVTDGVDRWVAPVTASLFTVNVQDLLRRLFAGDQIDLPIIAHRERPEAAQNRRQRVRLHTDEPDPLPSRQRARITILPEVQVSRKRVTIN